MVDPYEADKETAMGELRAALLAYFAGLQRRIVEEMRIARPVA